MTVPFPTTFAGTITVQHLLGPPPEHCIVTAMVLPRFANPLVSVSTMASTGLDVVFQVVAIRAPLVGLSETVQISGSWRATGATDNGISDMDCNGSGTILAQITVNVAPGTTFLTLGNFPFGGSAGEPISTETGELFGFDEREDLSLGGPLPLRFQRYYASYLSAGGISSALGTNWMHNFDVKGPGLATSRFIQMPNTHMRSMRSHARSRFLTMTPRKEF